MNAPRSGDFAAGHQQFPLPHVFVSAWPIAGTTAAATKEALDRTLSFDQRVIYQRRIEEVYWQHRIWPKENLSSKPPLDAVLTDAQIRARVEEYL